MKQCLSLVWIVLVYLVFPGVERLFFDQLEIVHLIEQVRQEKLGKTLRLGVDLKRVNGVDLFALF